MSNLIYYDKDHTYLRNGEYYQSVSGFLGKYKEPYDKQFWAEFKAVRKVIGEDRYKQMIGNLKKKVYGYNNPKDIRIFKEKELIKKELSLFKREDNIIKIEEAIKKIEGEWKETNTKAIKKGNDYHIYQEQKAKSEGVMFNPHTNSTFNVVDSIEIILEDGFEVRKPKYNSLSELEDGYHPELILWNDEFKICGQSDMVFIESMYNKRYIYINDWKTNSKITKSNYFSKMKAPLEHLDDSNYNHYRLQISMYAWMLEQAGFEVMGTRFTHLNKPYIFDYMKPEIELMLGIKSEDTSL